MTRDREMVMQMFALAKRYPMVNHQENLLLMKAAKRLDELTRPRALKWADAVKRGFRGEPGYITGYVDGAGLECDCWALLYSAHGDTEDDLYAIVNAGRLWTIRKDQLNVIIWSNVPTVEQIDEEAARRAKLAQE